MKRSPKTQTTKTTVKPKTTIKPKTVKQPAKSKPVTQKPVTPKTIKKEPINLRWKKITMGVHLHSDGKKYGKGDILECPVDGLSITLKRHFKCLDKIPEETDDGVTLKVQSLSDGKFNVVNPKTNEPINEKELTKDEAENIAGESIKE